MEDKIAKGNILVIEDDTDINHLEKKILSKAGYEVYQAFSGTEGLLLLDMHGSLIDVVVMDLMLPGMEGKDLISKIKEVSDANVLVVSAVSHTQSKVDLLTLGANDYITKPFEKKEFLARVGVQVRLAKTDGRGQVEKTVSENSPLESIQYKNLTIIPNKYEASVSGHLLNLTRQEMKVLTLLASNQGKIFSKQAIYEYAWDDIYIGEDSTINVHISNIRKKISEYDSDEYIKTVWGIGFKLC